MEENLLFKPVKDDGINKETFIEHAIKTYHVGNFLFDKLKLNIDMKKYLYACFFHDAGKLVIELGKVGHTPKSKDGLDLLKNLNEYQILLKNFELGDYSDDKEVLHAIEKHHDSDNELSAFTSIADQIASSSSNDDLKNRLKMLPISSLITYLNEMHGFNKYNFYSITIQSFSKNELNAIGKLILLKLLYESIGELNDIKLLYETLNGCRVVTTLEWGELRLKISEKFYNNIVSFIQEQDLSQLLRGAPDAYWQCNVLPEEVLSKINLFTVDKYISDILRDIKDKSIQKIEDVGFTKQNLIDFTELRELKKYKSNINNTKKKLLADENGKFPEWIVLTLYKDKEKIQSSPEAGEPILENLLKKVGVNTDAITNKKIVYEKLVSLAVAINSLKSYKSTFSLNLNNFITIDGRVSIDAIAKNQDYVCANCGTFAGKIPLSTFTLEEKKHYREVLFRKNNAEIRNEKILICEMCHVETLLNAFLCGVTYDRRQARVDTKTHLVLYGLDIDKDLINSITDKKLIDRLLKDFKITSESIYVKNRTDLQIILLSLSEFNVGIKNEIYRQLLFSLLAFRLKERNPLITSFSINSLPKSLNNEIVQFAEGDLNIKHGKPIDYFEYVYAYVNAKYDQKRDYILEYYNNPFIGIAQIFKREFLLYDEQTEKVVKKLAENDILHEITDQIWEMAKLGGGLETGKNVGSFLGMFKGRAEDVDKLVNKLLKNEKLSAEQRTKIIEIHQRTREILINLTEEKRKELKDYVQKTKYLFNSKKFYEIKKGKEAI
ncbi:MAG: hypothetical protein MPEBLZ_01882 [Candidatus Methanoperedens nitroreducens]|uniref:HD domain-containing protein n=1 Tax=Candidatus Methanoperedens nitratireducens TaxID=1392998 RepID=A0A0P8AGJ4_9EURY|nr:HD domain-containing protein [Candidatus Methanoperedens sp. BLZ2]KAB2946747.1 MAG: HD domain-containing protein [Candidatus Methanoperedens sp.]KPQ43500.1 MAG: hypothetical protein MPEBLZ_01882 [Candidatus Methanoperedens sp. BLZ1]MBZ0175833.1 HD domain-containing protein [Candidatus Methanoperedens nitroreducens]MCX9079291.1 HD domain-containing protein [Candidatus Methanoperedens sp.]